MKKMFKRSISLRVLITNLLLFAGFASIGQVTLKGKVIGENEKPLSNVSVTLSPGSNGAVTDLNGNYTFTNNIKS